jgi:uncharacterized protein YdeI (YjbR/CyaY-like superfamily)
MAKTPPGSDLPLLPFPSRAAFEAWLAAQPADSPGLWVKFARPGAGVPSISKAEAVEAALCHGWIDGQLGRIDAQWWKTRFTPRGARSAWSENNRATALRLIAEGRMGPRGLAEVERAKADGRWDAAYAPQSRIAVPDDLQAALDGAPAAAAFFATLDSANRYAVLYRVTTAKKPETRARRIAQLVAMLAEGRRIHG